MIDPNQLLRAIQELNAEADQQLARAARSDRIPARRWVLEPGVQFPRHLQERLDAADRRYGDLVQPFEKEIDRLYLRLSTVQEPDVIAAVLFELHQLVNKKHQAVQEIARTIDVFPDVSPDVEVIDTSTADQKSSMPRLKPGHIYIDVTDATREDVDRLWTVIEWRQEILRRRGMTRKKPRGAPRGPRPTSERSRWLTRTAEVGEDAARAEYRAEKNLGDGKYTPADYAWWNRHIQHPTK